MPYCSAVRRFDNVFLKELNFVNSGDSLFYQSCESVIVANNFLTKRIDMSCRCLTLLLMLLIIVQSSMAAAEFHGLDQFENEHSSLEHQKNRFVDSINNETHKDSDSDLNLLDCQHCGHCHIMHFYISSELFSYSFQPIDKPLLRFAHGYSYPGKSPDNPPPIS